MIDLFKVYMADTVGDKVKKVLDSGYIGEGDVVKEFEAVLKAQFSSDFLVSMNNGTSALHLAMRLIEKTNVRDTIVTTPLTCTATNWPALANGFKLKWVDIDSKNLNMDLDDLERKLDEHSAAILFVHWGGYPVDLDRVAAIQKKYEERYGYKIPVIEDCAHAFGSKYKNKPIGSHGNYNMFSFQAIKHLTCGDGGALILPTEEQYKRAKLLRWYGIDRESNRKDFRCEANIAEWGYKFHMNNINAAIGLENYTHMEWVLNRHKQNGSFYNDTLVNTPGVSLLETLPGHESSYWLYSFKVEDRDGFFRMMKDKGIISSQVHERNDKHSCVNEFKAFLPTLEDTIKKIVSIPVGWWVTEEQTKYIVDCIKGGW